MMAAAQAAAKAALEEAAARGGQNASTEQAQDMPNPNQSLYFERNIMEQLNDQVLQSQLAQQHPQMGDLMGYQMADQQDINSLIQMAQQQQERQLQEQLAARPHEHLFTVAQNGTILEASETVTGFPPNTLLMTSAYESMNEEDLPAFFLIKSRCWEKGRLDIGAFIRRQNIEGEWIWLEATIVQYIQYPVLGFIMREVLVEDEELALRRSHIARISALLIQAVEASRIDPRGTSGRESGSDKPTGWISDDVTALSQLLAMEDGGNGAQRTPENPSGNRERPDQVNKKFDPMAVMKDMRTGICLDLSTFDLSFIEWKLVTLIVTGRLQIEELAPLFIDAIDQEKDMPTALESHLTFLEQKRALAPSNVEGKTRRKRASGNAFDLRRARPQKKVVEGGRSEHQPHSLLISTEPEFVPPALSVINISYTALCNSGLEMLSEVIYADTVSLKTLDFSFCSIDEKGIICLCRAIRKRREKNLPEIKGLMLSGNTITYKAAKELGLSLTRTGIEKKKWKRRTQASSSRLGDGYDEDDELDPEDFDDDDDDDDAVFGYGKARKRTGNGKFDAESRSDGESDTGGLELLHLTCASLSPEALHQLLMGLGQDCPIRELNLSSNDLGARGATLMVEVLGGQGVGQINKSKPMMPKLDRIDISNNNLENDGIAEFTRIISKRRAIDFVDLRLSGNNIGYGGVETLMNRLLHHNLVSLSLDKNAIGDRGCQLVAASLPSMHHICRLNLNFNQIGSRGIATLMRALMGCESLMYLGVSGNILKIAGAIAMGFALSQHPRLEELDLDNCCLSKVAQCHIIAGIISNRWVPMKRMSGFRAEPPMVAIGALEPAAQPLTNEQCFKFRRDAQMKNILQWMKKNRAAKIVAQQRGGYASGAPEMDGTASQSAYLRMLKWLSQIPFDEDELNDLRKYFYDPDGGDGGDGLRGSDGKINLKLRGDLLAALASDVADEIRDTIPLFSMQYGSSPGLDLSSTKSVELFSVWNSYTKDAPLFLSSDDEVLSIGDEGSGDSVPAKESKQKRRRTSRRNGHDIASENFSPIPEGGLAPQALPQISSQKSVGAGSVSSLSKQSTLSRIQSDISKASQAESTTPTATAKPRIAMFSQFAAKLEMLKTSAQEMMDQEDDPAQQDVIAKQFAEASLTLLRQLRYHCMNSGYDGWRQGQVRRKVLIVDDSVVTRKMVSRAFEKANYVVDTAANGEVGLAKMKESIYDIAFMDIDMPVMNGFDATKQLREWEDIYRPGARQPICALTAQYVDAFERSELLKYKNAGLDVMESKPCNIPRLFKVVDDVSPMFSDLSISQREAAMSAMKVG